MADLAPGAKAVFAWGPGEGTLGWVIYAPAYGWRARLAEVTNNAGNTLFCPGNSEAEKTAFYVNVGLNCTVDRTAGMHLTDSGTKLAKYSSFGYGQAWDQPGYAIQQGFYTVNVGANSPPPGYHSTVLVANEVYLDTNVGAVLPGSYVCLGMTNPYTPGTLSGVSIGGGGLTGAWVAAFTTGYYTVHSYPPYQYLYLGAYQFVKPAGTIVY
jgi:hypothetical protein